VVFVMKNEKENTQNTNPQPNQITHMFWGRSL
jgi:hypothetical protein